MFALFLENLRLWRRTKSALEILLLFLVGYHEGEGDDNGSFVDIMGGISAACGAESEGWTFADALVRANLSAESLAEGVVDSSRLPTRESSFFTSH